MFTYYFRNKAHCFYLFTNKIFAYRYIFHDFVTSADDINLYNREKSRVLSIVRLKFEHKGIAAQFGFINFDLIPINNS